MSTKIKGIHHFALVVSNLTESVEWYQRHLGFQFELESSWPERGLKVVHILHDSGIRLEIFEQGGSAPSPDLGRDAFQALFTQGAKHIALEVIGLDEIATSLTEQGIELVHPIGPVPFAPLRNFWIRDNAGNLIEFIERTQ